MYNKSIIKWAGGKSQLLPDIIINLPDNRESITTYIEPFIGSATVFLNIITKFPNLKTVVINDLNPILTNLFYCIKHHLNAFNYYVTKIFNDYTNSNNHQEFYNNIKMTFNKLKHDPSYIETLFPEEYDSFYNDTYVDYKTLYKLQLSAMFIFLNKTCFNGLYRENKKGEFNVPWNKSVPKSFFEHDDLMNIWCKLNRYNVIIVNDSYENVVNEYLTENTFVYFDPPYRPLTKTSAFTAYTKSGFNDNNQIELKELCDKINNTNSYFMLSNSDPHNTDINDNFFDDLYNNYNIHRVYASRSINSKGDKRGKITEILVTNY